jgi:outer membrane protein assembly factor BamB
MLLMLLFLLYLISWKYPIESNFYSNLTVGLDNRVYVATDRGNIYAINSDGSLYWQYKILNGIYFSPTIGLDRTVYVGTDGGILYALTPKGKFRWCKKTGLRITSPVVVNQNAIYVIADYCWLYSLGLDGAYKWSHWIYGSVSNSPALGINGRIYLSSDEGWLYVFNPNGSLNWECKLDARILTTPAVSCNGSVYVGTNRGFLYAIGLHGKTIWQYQIGHNKTSAPVLGPEGMIYIGSDNGELCAISQNGKLCFKVQTGFWSYGAPIVEAKRIIYGKPPLVNILDPQGFLIDIVFLYTPEEVLSLKVNGDRFYAGSTHYLWAFGASDTLLPDSMLIPTVNEAPDRMKLQISGDDITYELLEPGKITIKVYDIIGRVVKVLWEGEKQRGHYRFFLNTVSLPKGLYFLLLENANYRITKKLVILK